jgi:hypothetical protein
MKCLDLNLIAILRVFLKQPLPHYFKDSGCYNVCIYEKEDVLACNGVMTWPGFHTSIFTILQDLLISCQPN